MHRFGWELHDGVGECWDLRSRPCLFLRCCGEKTQMLRGYGVLDRILRSAGFCFETCGVTVKNIRNRADAVLSICGVRDFSLKHPVCGE